ncbi:MAG: PSD1 and planctomycete cytochrome C domain-containing protein [Bryobacteraceae bacterium]
MRSIAILLWCGVAFSQTEGTFTGEVLPLLERNCLPCHGAESRTSGLVATTVEGLMAGGARHGAAISPGHPEQSVLIRALRGELAPRMPIGKAPLSNGDIEKIATWIRHFQPAKPQTKQRWWAFAPPKRTEPPPVKATAWVRNPIDRFVLAALEAKGLAPAAEADKRTLARRLYFDLTGLPPAPEEMDRFLADESPKAYEDLADRLLADSRYGERWGRHWLDLARYADTMGFEADREQYHMWRYRDYVIRSLNNDKPYDQFIREQLAGDEITPSDPDRLVATGFLRLGPVFQTTIAAQSRQMILSEITNTVSSVFLGLTVGCAQCHDHKYDPIPQRDYYRLQAFFAPMELIQADVPIRDAALKARLDTARKAAEAKLSERQGQLQAYENTLVAKWRNACANGCDGQKIEPKGLKTKLLTAIANGLVPNDDSTFTLDEKLRYLELLDYVDTTMGGRDLGVFRREVERHKARAHVVRNITVSGNNAEPPVSFVRLRGEYDQLGDRVEPGFLTAITGKEVPAELPTDTFGNVRTWRIGLAKWIASADNPLTSRVMVNRLWQKHFGAGLVATPSDFGRNGGFPSHPELLDWLALELPARGWSLKAMHRLMVTSSAYRQSSNTIAEPARKADPANRLLSHMNRRRLEGELMRDAILAVSGRLNPEAGGPGVFPRLPAAIEGTAKIKNFTAWEPSADDEARRRSIYVFQRRQIEFPFLSVMDAPVLQAPREVRPESTTALQALTLLNGRLVTEEARAFADRLRREGGASVAEQVRRAYLLALGRPPSAEEEARARDFVATLGADGLLGLARVLYNTNEFIYVD